MQAFDHSVAKREVGRAMLQGRSWREAVQTAGVQMSRATAYRLRQRMLAHGEDAIGERRQGQPTKVCGAIRAWLEGYYQQHSQAPGRAVQALLEAHHGVRVSVTHLNRVRATLTGATRRGGEISRGRGKMGQAVSSCWQQHSKRTCSQRWRRRSLPRRMHPPRADWHGPLPERGGSLSSPCCSLAWWGCVAPGTCAAMPRRG